jgi:hypothetical protein
MFVFDAASGNDDNTPLFYACGNNSIGAMLQRALVKHGPTILLMLLDDVVVDVD